MSYLPSPLPSKWPTSNISLISCADELQIQAQLPLTLVPIRIDVEVPAHQPLEAFPLPRGVVDSAINPTLPGYRRPDPLPTFRIKDTFLWNLHEALATPDDFANTFVRDLDLPNPQGTTMTISGQIRQQLEEYAGVALHPLFQIQQRQQLHLVNGGGGGDGGRSMLNDSILNPDDAYRCLVHLNINLQNKLYTDKFEWSLLHPAGMAEEFAQVTCADLGLGGEWVSAIAHGIYEAVLRLKKEVCESGGFAVGGSGMEIDNQAVSGMEAGWRYDPDALGDEWEPKVETLSKEEIERREGDRERQIRRLRRETARISSSTAAHHHHGGGGALFDQPIDGGADAPLGRGERSKRKRRLRSTSPSGGTPGTRGTPDANTGAAGYGGDTLNDWYV